MSGRIITAIVSLVLASFSVTAVAHGQAAPADNASGRDRLPGGLINPLAAQSLEGLAATRDRPLFSPTRRPPPPPPQIVAAPPPPPPPPEPPSVLLVGVVMDGEEAKALVRFTTVNKVIHARIGDDIEGWKVAQIEGRKLVLSLDGRLATFTMFSGERAKEPPKPVSASRPGDSKDSAVQGNVSQTQPQRSEAQSQQPQASRSSRRHRRERQ